MANLIDFDRKYMEFAASALKGMVDLKEEELEQVLNDTVSRWLNTGADWLGGKTPDEFFSGMRPEELVERLEAYAQGGVNVPEPLYRRISETKECAAGLFVLARDGAKRVGTRGTALRLLCDLNAEGLGELCADMLLEGGELSEAAAEWLGAAGYRVVEPLLRRYSAADEGGRDAILDVLCGYPGDGRTAELLAERLLNDHGRRAMHAQLAARLGAARLIEPLETLAQLSELTYYDYMEIENAIEALGGEPERERSFYGDQDYEALRRGE